MKLLLSLMIFFISLFYDYLQILTYCVGGRTTNVNTCTCMCKHDTMYPGGVCTQMHTLVCIWGVCTCVHVHNTYMCIHVCMQSTWYSWDECAPNGGQTGGTLRKQSGGVPFMQSSPKSGVFWGFVAPR